MENGQWVQGRHKNVEWQVPGTEPGKEAWRATWTWFLRQRGGGSCSSNVEPARPARLAKRKSEACPSWAGDLALICLLLCLLAAVCAARYGLPFIAERAACVLQAGANEETIEKHKQEQEIKKAQAEALKEQRKVERREQGQQRASKASSVSESTPKTAPSKGPLARWFAPVGRSAQ